MRETSVGVMVASCMDPGCGSLVRRAEVLAHPAVDDTIIAFQAWDIPALTGYEGIAIDPAIVREGTIDAVTRSNCLFENCAILGGTTIASGQILMAWAPFIAVRTPRAFAS